MSTNPPFDNNSVLFREAFDQALSYSAYVETGTSGQRARWQAYEERAQIGEQTAEVLSGFTRKMNVLVLAGMWCGDCARQCPMLSRIAEKSSVIDLRFLDNNAVPQLRDLLRIHGAARVPVALFLSEDFFEIGRFGDRTLTAYKRKAEQELGAACDAGIVPPPESELQAELSEWLVEFQRLQLMLRVSPMLRARHGD